MNIDQQVRIDASLRAIAEEAMKMPADAQVAHVKEAMQRLQGRLDISEAQADDVRVLLEGFELRALGYLRAMQEVEGFSVFLEDLQHGLEATHAPVSRDNERARISFLITMAQREALRDLGYSDDDIHRMSPQDAHEILALPKREKAAHSHNESR